MYRCQWHGLKRKSKNCRREFWKKLILNMVPEAYFGKKVKNGQLLLRLSISAFTVDISVTNTELRHGVSIYPIFGPWGGIMESPCGHQRAPKSIKMALNWKKLINLVFFSSAASIILHVISNKIIKFMFAICVTHERLSWNHHEATNGHQMAPNSTKMTLKWKKKQSNLIYFSGSSIYLRKILDKIIKWMFAPFLAHEGLS